MSPKDIRRIYQGELRGEVIKEFICHDDHAVMLSNETERDGQLEVCQILDMIHKCLR
jgi:hypothetical protein